MTPLLTIEDATATITLRRPSLANKLTLEDLQVLRGHVRSVDARSEVRILMLRSGGRHFCSGFDIAHLQESQNEGRSFGGMVDVFEQCRAVTVAVIQGGIYGGATDLALACDLRLGSTATEMFLPAAKLGLHYYQSGLERFVTRLGVDMAKRIFLAGERLDAQAMHACGFLTHLAEPDALESAAAKLSTSLLGMAPLPLLGMKRNLNLIARGQQDAGAIAQAVFGSIASEDIREGAAAWRDKRAPVFKGR